MYEIEKNKFINPGQIAVIEVDEVRIVTPDRPAGTMEVTVFMSNNKFYQLTRPRNEAIAIVNHIFSMINAANNPFLTLPADGQPGAPTKEKPKMPANVIPIPSRNGTAPTRKAFATGKATKVKKPPVPQEGVLEDFGPVVEEFDEPDEMVIPREPSDGKGAGQHQVDPKVYPPDEYDEHGNLINPVV